MEPDLKRPSPTTAMLPSWGEGTPCAPWAGSMRRASRVTADPAKAPHS